MIQKCVCVWRNKRESGHGLPRFREELRRKKRKDRKKRKRKTAKTRL